MLRGKHQRLAIMDINHSLVACCRDDDKAIALIGFKPFMHLCQAGEKQRSVVFQGDEVGLLLFGINRILDPLIPPVARWREPTLGRWAEAV
jgi:hypothetical protein